MEFEMNEESTLLVVDQANITESPGGAVGQTLKPLVGYAGVPTERIRASLATFAPGSHEHLHWHLIEVYYYVLSGHAIVRDYHGKEYEVGPGVSIYAPAGLAGAHEWQVKEGLQLLAFRATTDRHRMIQFTVDRDTKQSSISHMELIKKEGIKFNSHY